MSKTILEIRRKSDNKILLDIINDACQVHNIYEDDILIESDHDYNIGYNEGTGFDTESPYEVIGESSLYNKIIAYDDKIHYR